MYDYTLSAGKGGEKAQKVQNEMQSIKGRLAPLRRAAGREVPEVRNVRRSRAADAGARKGTCF